MQGGQNRGAEGAQALRPSFLDLCSKNFKISQIWAENFFFYLVVPPIKNLLPSTLLTILKANYGLFLTFSQASLELETT